MNVSEQIIAVIDSLCEKFGIAIDWTQENIWPYLQSLFQKYITYEICTSVMWIVAFSVLFIISCTFYKKISKKFHNDQCSDDAYILSVALLIFTSLILFIITLVQATDIITSITFPEKMIFEYVQKLTHHHG